MAAERSLLYPERRPLADDRELLLARIKKSERSGSPHPQCPAQEANFLLAELTIRLWRLCLRSSRGPLHGEQTPHFTVVHPPPRPAKRLPASPAAVLPLAPCARAPSFDFVGSGLLEDGWQDFDSWSVPARSQRWRTRARARWERSDSGCRARSVSLSRISRDRRHWWVRRSSAWPPCQNAYLVW